jgi:outer membrane protein with beta-barrel domain
MQRSVAVAVVLAVCTPSLAAQTPPRRVGLGMAFSSGGSAGSYGIYVPIAVAPRFRMEPEFGVSSWTTTYDLGTGPLESKDTQIFAGVGFLFLSDAGTDVKVYVGPRAGLAWISREDTNPSSGSQESHHTDWWIALAGGGEYYLAERFSLGGEVLIAYTHGGEPQGNGFPSTASYLGTSATAFLRWYP